MSSYLQSVSWWCLTPHLLSPLQLARAAADIGYAAVELLPEEYWALAKEHGLAIASVNGHDSIIDGLNQRANHGRIARELERKIAKAEQWQIANLICFSGSRRALNDAEGIEATAEGLRQAARQAEDAGVTLVLELLNSKVDHPDYQCDRTAWGVKVCQFVNSPRVQLLYDIYHMQIMEGDVIRTIRDNHRYFGHYHTAGNPGRNEIDDSQELNYRPIVKAIRDTGFEGYLAQEFIPNGDPVAGLKHALEICKT